MKFVSSARSLLMILPAIVFLQACGGENPFRVDFSAVPPPFKISEAISDTTLPDGLKIYVIEEGEGPFEVVYKDRITVKITARTGEGEIFNSSYLEIRAPEYTKTLSNLYPYTIQLPGVQFPVSPLNEGKRKGLLGMREGEKRIIVVPPELGDSGIRNGVRLEGQTLIYDVELVNIVGT